MEAATKQVSTMLQYLPAIYQDSGETTGDAERIISLNDFLLAFEKILLGLNDGIEPADGSKEFLGEGPARFQGLEEKIASLHYLFDPNRAPEAFLEWLAEWSALTLPVDLSESGRRALIAEIIPLYRIRGTKHYLERMLQLILGGGATVDDRSWQGIQVGCSSTVGSDTWLGGSQPHHFRVKLTVSPGDENLNEARYRLARHTIDLAKPAHTYYDLEIIAPRFQVGVHSRAGVDTFLV